MAPTRYAAERRTTSGLSSVSRQGSWPLSRQLPSCQFLRAQKGAAARACAGPALYFRVLRAVESLRRAYWGGVPDRPLNVVEPSSLNVTTFSSGRQVNSM